MKVLILGGTSESRSLAQALHVDGRFDVTTSLAGRVRDPALPVGRVRSGGFGGPDGLASWIRDNQVDVVVDATHPFAAEISRNAASACARTSTPSAVLRRRPWTAGPDDRWIPAESMTEAATIVAQQPRRVFLTIGRQGVDAFAENASSWFLIRSIDAPDTSMPPHHEVLLARGPFDSAGEIELMRSRGIELVVSKNSGGAMTEAKLVAARELRIPIVMIDRPRTPPGDFETGAVDDVVSWLRRRL